MPAVLVLYRLLAGPHAPDKAPLTEEAAWQLLAGDSRQQLPVAEADGRRLMVAVGDLGRAHGCYKLVLSSNLS